MKKLICTLSDVGSSEFKDVFLEDSEYSASRNFESNYISQRKHSAGLLWSHFEDFSVRCIGYFDTVTGTVESIEPYLIITGDEIAYSRSMPNVEDGESL